jgi:hypothetical protein
MDTILMGWPYVGLRMAPLLLVGLALERRPGALPRFQDPAWVLPLLWPMYLLHQFEEHGIDMLGRHYVFLGDLCDTLGHAQAPSGCPADPAFIFAVNAVGCQMAFALSFLFRRRRPLVAACAWGIPLVNGVAHVGAALAHRAYNPGGRRSRRRQVWHVRLRLLSAITERATAKKILDHLGLPVEPSGSRSRPRDPAELWVHAAAVE